MFKTTFKDAVQKDVTKGGKGDGGARNLPSGLSKRSSSGNGVGEMLYDDVSTKKIQQPEPGKSLKVL